MKGNRREERQRRLARALTGALVGCLAASPLQAADTVLRPATSGESVRSYDIPPGPLGDTLNRVARRAGAAFAFDPALVNGKRSQGVSGQFATREAFDAALKDSGLEIQKDASGSWSLRPARPVELPALGAAPVASAHMLSPVTVRAKRIYEIGPLPGLGLTKEEIPGNVQSISAEEIKQAHTLSLTELMNRKLQSVTVNDYQGNPFQMDVQYRGFTAGPQIGTPQGLSVFFDGIRVNEPFGDVVNWDMIPMNALAGVDVFPGSNPIFGLNTLGGAFTVKTKDGFNHRGFDAEVLTGSYGRRQLQVEGGWNNGSVALFGAGNFFVEDGWRENSPSKVNQAFGKASWRGERLDLNLSSLVVWNDLVGNGLVPSSEYSMNRNGVFTSPDTTDNRLFQFQLSGAFQVNDTFSITGQVYRRNSKRHSVGADVMTGYSDGTPLRRSLAGEEYTCLFNSTNSYGLPDYYVLSIENPSDPFMDFLDHPLVQASFAGDLNINEQDALDAGLIQASDKNKALPDDVLAFFKSEYRIWNNALLALVLDRGFSTAPAVNPGPSSPEFFDEPSYFMDFWASTAAKTIPTGSIGVGSGVGNFYYTKDANGVVSKHYIMIVGARNTDACAAAQAQDSGTLSPYPNTATVLNPVTGVGVTIDGAVDGTTGVVQGVPTAVLTDNEINQMINGASLQFNWNLEQHKVMFGLSVDSASASYGNEQRLGLLDANRNAYLAPDEILPQFAAARIGLRNNDFSGTNVTRSLYFSETWKPVEDWSFNASARYNITHARNTVATRYGIGVFEIDRAESLPNYWGICIDGQCPTTGYVLADLTNPLNAAETERFTYKSFNPSVGATWQARPDLNVYANVSRGARTPSVIELGCALDKRPSGLKVAENGVIYDVPMGIAQNRSCSLPTTLSGDPYLPQIRSTSIDVGMRGTYGNNMQWNLGAFQTDLKNDIYFGTQQGGTGFFDTVGDTRRRGIEAGLSGVFGKASFRLNYALTDATFEDDFFMLSGDNSSSTYFTRMGDGVIHVKPGSRIPGVSLHNVNASVSYDLTDNWSIGFSAVMHSDSYLRGNENNEHQPGITQYRDVIVPDGNGYITVERVARQPSTNPGKVPGYAVFNFQTTYRLSREWSATLLINNLFDREYFSAGRLGRNPFSPSVQGAIGPDGYNHNSNDWLATNFIAPGAPRGVWFTLRYQMDAGN